MQSLQTGCCTPSAKSELLTPLPGAPKPESPNEDEEALILKRKLAFEEEQKEEVTREELPPEPEKEAPAESKPRSSRTTATKISPALLQKIENNQSGVDLKITALIPFDGLSNLCEALSRNSSTERLDLEGCGVGDKGCVLIRDLLIRNRQIKHVDLQMNQITDVGCRYLSEILPKNHTLHKLYLGYNDIKDDGVYALIAAMRPRGQLEIVVSGNTNVSDQALGRLDRALEQQWKPVSAASKLKKEILSPDANPYMELFGSSSPKKSSSKSKAKCNDDDEPLSKRLKTSSICESPAEKPKEPAEKAEKSKESVERPERSKEKGNPSQQEKSDKVKEKAERADRSKDTPPKKANQSVVRKAAGPPSNKSPQRTTKEDVGMIEEEMESPDVSDDGDQDLYKGTPFKYKLITSLNSSIWSEEREASAQSPTRVADPYDLHSRQREGLAVKFNMQWKRLKAFIEDQLEQEARELSYLPAPKNLFGRACQFVSRQQGFQHRKWSAAAMRKNVPRQDPSEGERRKRVDARIKAIVLKFRHMIEDTSREQRSEAEMLATLHGTLLPSQGEVPAGYSTELGFVHVPCPFKLQVQICGHQGDAPAIQVL